MTRSEAGKLGGQVNAERSRKEALDKYYSDPNYCKKCGKIIKVRQNEQPGLTRRKQFCNHSCAASYTNRGVCRNPNKTCNNERWVSKDAKEVTCKCCETKFTTKRENGKVKRRSICDRCLKLGLYIPNRDESQTLQEIMHQRGITKKSDQRLRSVVVAHSRKVYKRAEKPFVCEICGYEKHVNICHIKAWTKFSLDTCLKEINDLGNLVALCPNHHWEFDHNLLDSKDRATLAQR